MASIAQSDYHMNTAIRNLAISLRAALKSAKFSARQVTVRTRDSTLDVTIRAAGVSLAKVRAIARSFESVRREHASGGILCAGNRLVNVDYADALLEPLKASIFEALEAAPLGDTIALPGGFSAVKLLPGHGVTYRGDVSMAGPGFDGSNDLALGVVWAAERLAIAYLDADAATQDTRA